MSHTNFSTLPTSAGYRGELAMKALRQEARQPDEAEPPGLVRHVTAGAEIYAEGDQATAFYKVVSGVVRTCRFLSDGRRQVDAFHMAGDVFGLEAGETHRLTAEAVNECTIICCRSERKMPADGIRFAQQFFHYAMRRAERAQDHSLLLGRRGATEKLAAFLLEIAERQGSEDTVDLVMSRQDIADYLGLTIETVSRTLSLLERQATIALPSTRRILLRDPEQLRYLVA